MRDWYKDRVFYQVWPRAFRDGDGDGVGDLEGVIQALDYLQSLGVGAIWFSPFFASPQVDFGYDVSDYCAVAPEYGDLATFDRLAAACHKRDIKILLDLVLNHTSDQHTWFQQSRRDPTGPYSDYYIWRAPRGTDAQGNPLPPNNWESIFGGPAWTYDEARGEFYLHVFAKEQPDLNYDNPAVRAEMARVMEFWTERGADGFRFDAVNCISKPEGLPDDPDARAPIKGLSLYKDGPRMREYLLELRQALLAANPDAIVVGEAAEATTAYALDLCAPGPRQVFDMVFTFEHMTCDCGVNDYDPRPFSLPALASCLGRWQTDLHGRAWNALYLENHDHPRSVNRFGNPADPLLREKSAEALAVSYLFLEGTPFIYQGQELGTVNWEPADPGAYQDVDTRRQYVRLLAELGPQGTLERLHRSSREGARAPLPWSDQATTWPGQVSPEHPAAEKPSGATGTQPTQPLSPASFGGVLDFYRRTVALRQSLPAVRHGVYRSLAENRPDVYAYERAVGTAPYLRGQRVVVVASFADGPAEFVLPADAALAEGASLELANYPDAALPTDGRTFALRPREALVIVEPPQLPSYLRDTDLWLFGTGKARRAYDTFGCHPLAMGTPDPQGFSAAAPAAWSFTVWAPHARAVSVVGDFNGWHPDTHPMVQVRPGIWTAVAPGLQNGSPYKYAVTGADGIARLKADPYAFHAEHGLATASKAWDLGGYHWHDDSWLADRTRTDLRERPVSIYELHLGSWWVGDDGHGTVDDAPGAEQPNYPNYRAVADRLAAYCTRMGYTHVELLPVTEHPLLASWGYQCTGYYAVESRYGTPQDLMYLVDTLHASGVGVIFDWVPAHFPKDGWALASFDGAPLYEYPDTGRGEHPEWGTLVFDYGIPQVVSFLVSSACFLLDVYHADGIRVDAVSSMAYRNYGRPGWADDRSEAALNQEALAFLRTLNDAVRQTFPGAVTVAEESTALPGVTAPTAQGGLGFSFKWDMGFMHDTLDYLGCDPLWRRDHHERLTFGMTYAFSEHYILPFSHDEVVHGKRSMLQKMWGDYLQRFDELKALVALQFARPGKKLTFMGSEFGQVIEWDFEQGLDWFLLDDYAVHREMQGFSARLNAFYREHPALWAVDDSWDGFVWANVHNRDEDAIAFVRTAQGWPAGEKTAGPRVQPADEGAWQGEAPADLATCDVLACFNFSPRPLVGLTVGLPRAGTLCKALVTYGGDSADVGCANPDAIEAVEQPFEGSPWSARVNVAPFSAVYFEFWRNNGEKG